ncbi:Hypothetical protein GLP15_464 [Giardia lamblia P15]|uniref:MSP domain-containing protein n=1 Tax=Giardia intestinalis (strain P15) TaxID=658858 RepID=E1F0A0_GIAIA|nr:Hypothetical protein GLP15_464 [Giardia lamblia P15]
MTLSASPSPLSIRPSSTAILAITNSGTTGYCFQLAAKYKNELKYSPKRGFISAGTEQLITVAALSNLTPGLRVQIYAVATEKSLGIPDDNMVRIIIDGAKRLKTPCVNLKVDVINLDAQTTKEHLSQLPPVHMQKSHSVAPNFGNDSETSLFDNYVTQTQKSSYSVTNNTDTLYSSDHTCISLIDSQLCETSGKRIGQVNSQGIDKLDIDVGQLKLKLQTLENKVDTILETIPLTSTFSKSNASQNFELSETDMNGVISAVIERLSTEFKSQLVASVCNVTAPYSDKSKQETLVQEALLEKETSSASLEDKEQSQEKVPSETIITDTCDVKRRKQLNNEVEAVMNSNGTLNSISNSTERETSGVRDRVSGQLPTLEASRSSSETSAGKQLQNALGQMFILSIIFAIAACTKLLKRALRSKREA